MTVGNVHRVVNAGTLLTLLIRARTRIDTVRDRLADSRLLENALVSYADVDRLRVTVVTVAAGRAAGSFRHRDVLAVAGHAAIGSAGISVVAVRVERAGESLEYALSVNALVVGLGVVVVALKVCLATVLLLFLDAVVIRAFRRLAGSVDGRAVGCRDAAAIADEVIVLALALFALVRCALVFVVALFHRLALRGILHADAGPLVAHTGLAVFVVFAVGGLVIVVYALLLFAMMALPAIIILAAFRVGRLTVVHTYSLAALLRLGTIAVACASLGNLRGAETSDARVPEVTLVVDETGGLDLLLDANSVGALQACGAVGIRTAGVSGLRVASGTGITGQQRKRQHRHRQNRHYSGAPISLTPIA